MINKEARKYKPHYRYLPAHLSYDEFKYAKGQMAFQYVDADTGDIIDILNKRDSYTIKNHFIANYHRKTSDKMQTITIDMNAGYVSVIKGVFPKAKIIIDRFHIVRSMKFT